MFLFDQLSSVLLAVRLVSRFLRCVMLILAILDCTNHTELLDQTQREVTALVMCNIYMVFQTFNRRRASATVQLLPKPWKKNNITECFEFFFESVTVSAIIKEAGVPSSFSFILTSSTGRYYFQNWRYRDQLHIKKSSAENLAALQMALHHKPIPIFILYCCVYLYCSVALGIFCSMVTWLLDSL